MHDTNLNCAQYLDQLLIPLSYNHFSLRLYQTLVVAKPVRYKNADFFAIPQSWPLSLHIPNILAYFIISILQTS